MTVNEFIDASNKYNQLVDITSEKLNKIREGNLTDTGMVNDETKNSTEYKRAKSNYDNAFNQLRKYNGTVSNSIKREARKIRRGY